MPIERKPKRKNYTVIPNEILQDERLSPKALGVLLRALRKPDTCRFSKKTLREMNPTEGECSIESAIDELKRCGYLTVQKCYPSKASHGRITYEYVFREIPLTQIQEGENHPLVEAIQEGENHPLVEAIQEGGFQGVENHPPYKYSMELNTESISNTQSSGAGTGASAENDFYKPTIGDVEAYCQEKGYTDVDATIFVAYWGKRSWRLRDGRPIRLWRKFVDSWHNRAIEYSSQRNRPETSSDSDVDPITGRYKATYDLSEIEAMFDAEWMSDTSPEGGNDDDSSS